MFPFGGWGVLNFSFYAPNFEEVEGAYWFGSVRAWCESVMRE